MAEPFSGKWPWPSFAIERVGRAPRPGRLERIRAGRDQYPVGGVSWYEAAAYARFVGKSLPTVYHWVRAAGARIAGYITPFSNISTNGITAVGGRPGVSPFGAFDMAGNVREWVWNEMPTGSTRYILGGAWTDPGTPSNTPNSLAVRPFRPERFSPRGVSRFPAVPGRTDRAHSTPCARLYERRACIRRGLSRIRERLCHRSGTARSESRIDRLERQGLVQREGQLHSRVRWRTGARVLVPPRNVRPPYQTVVYFPGRRCGNVANERGARDRHVRFPDAERPSRFMSHIQGHLRKAS